MNRPGKAQPYSQLYEELRAAIDGGSETFTHEDALEWVRAIQDGPVCTLSRRVHELVGLYGGLRKAAVQVGLSPGYLSRLRAGTKTDPSSEVLDRLGLKRVVHYERVGYD